MTVRSRYVKEIALQYVVRRSHAPARRRHVDDLVAEIKPLERRSALWGRAA